jgi:hypothetical protein
MDVAYKETIIAFEANYVPDSVSALKSNSFSDPAAKFFDCCTCAYEGQPSGRHSSLPINFPFSNLVGDRSRSLRSNLSRELRKMKQSGVVVHEASAICECATLQ